MMTNQLNLNKNHLEIQVHQELYMELLEFFVIAYVVNVKDEQMQVIMVRENKVNNVNHLYYDEQNNEILYLDHVYVINLNLYLYMVNVVEMIEKEYP